ncbi:MAG: deoxynucleoside kinase, partial [Selenomonadaceae bacterium]|nr:deoxynucleoside kinase [Selenomonadaceae bacterium]
MVCLIDKVTFAAEIFTGGVAVMGKLVVIEGSDGSGKATQTRKLYERLRDLEVNVRRVSFPNYESESSALIKMYLRGDFGGDAEAVNPYAAAAFYAVDRFAGFVEWKKFYERGGLVLSDRYVGSNMAYQAAKFKKKTDRTKFLTWLDDLEYERFKLPRPDMTIFLDMPPAISAILRKERGREDIHENDADYMEKTYNAYKEIAQRFDWNVVPCADKNFARSTTDIHENILA